MKKILCLLLVLATCLSLFACSKKKNYRNTTATEEDIAKLESLYAGLEPHHGQIHDHSDSGRRSDGAATLAVWKEHMPTFGVEFAALLDHRQTDHMYHEDWDATLFISGTEAMTFIKDRDPMHSKYHYNMIFPNVSDMEALLTKYTDLYHFNNGTFRYGAMTAQLFTMIIQDVQASGGFFVIAHPGQTMGELSEDPLEYYYCDGVGYEVFYHPYGEASIRGAQTQINYNIYVGLLAAGKKVYATAGSDGHSMPTEHGLTTIYTAQKQDVDYVQQLHCGNFTAGPVGVRMCIGDAVMGSTTDFAGQRVVISVGDFHSTFSKGQYVLKVFTDAGEVLSVDLASTDTSYIAFDADESAAFYRVEIHDTTQEYPLLAMGNPIWNN